jgi:Cu/Ag efflux protein CusF
MKMLSLLLAVALAAPLLPAVGQTAAQTAASKSAATAKVELADGEVRRIDKANGMVLLKHGELKAVGMGPMTMSFKLKDPKWADGLKEGDKIKFVVEQKGNDLVVTQIVK